MSATREYRVRWRREERSGTSQIYQTEKGAREKVTRLIELEHLKRGEEPSATAGMEGMPYGADMDLDYYENRFGDMPDLVGPPVIEHRAVGAWGPVEVEASRLVPSIPGQLEIDGQEAA